MKKVLYFLIPIIIIGLASYGVYYRIESKSNTKKDEQKHKVDEKKSIVKVETQKAFVGDLPMYINCTGLAKSSKSVKISTKVSGTVEKLMVSNGTYVKKGDVLVKLESEDIELAFENAEVELTKAKLDYGIEKSYSNLKNENRDNIDLAGLKEQLDIKYKAGKINEDEYQDQLLELDVKKLMSNPDNTMFLRSKTGLSSKLINFKKNKIDYDNLIITAPFSGYIANLDLVEGQDVGNGYDCFDLIDLENIEIEVPVLETEISDLVSGRNATISFNSFPDQKFLGKVKNINPMLEENSSTCKVTISIKNENLIIKPGMSANVSIEGKIYKDRLLVPRSAILVRDNRKLLFRVEGDLAKWIYVTTGKENVDFIEVLDKIEVNDEIVVSNNYTLAHDAQVKVTN
ncbi:MAG: efflux RND transporter periplasmic adaptor subunit [Candidatus Delongbacteria bacterium]|nr:efflux RND transporter periplasmic adaptor subunit [Candidatus Delongbacteria bacterium]MBN2834955.1 efflux RND transporter periplasmic adaptor subunit [Candidatus Delongbacteria bacterium]